MHLTANDIPWAPQDCPDYLCLLGPNQAPPKSRDQFLYLQLQLLRRLIEGANDKEIRGANTRLENNLTVDQLNSLPGGLAHPLTPQALIFNPAPVDSRLYEWREEIEERLALPPMGPEDLREEVEGLSLESFLSRLL